MRAQGEVVPFPVGRVEARGRFDEFFEEEHERLFKALYFVTGNRHDAEELMQDAFLSLWERWDDLGRIEDLDDRQRLRLIDYLSRDVATGSRGRNDRGVRGFWSGSVAGRRATVDEPLPLVEGRERPHPASDRLLTPADACSAIVCASAALAARSCSSRRITRIRCQTNHTPAITMTAAMAHEKGRMMRSTVSQRSPSR
jgi:hypothetical protein